MGVMSWIWIAVIVLAVVVEASTTELVSIWFVPAALLGILLDYWTVPPLWQILFFVIFSILAIAICKTIMSKCKQARGSKTNLDAVIGSKCTVTERIDNSAGCGQAKVGSMIWSARGVGENDTFEVGEVLSVVAIEGVKLIVKKI